MIKAKVYRLTFKSFSIEVRLLSKGEICECFETLGYHSLEVPPDNLSDQVRLETIIVLKAKQSEGSIFSIPAGLVSVISRFVLEKSGFLENTQTQNKIIEDAEAYLSTVEGRSDALIMTTFPAVSPIYLKSLSYQEWTKLVYQACYVQSYLNQRDISAFLSSEIPTDSNEPRPDQRLVQLGLVKNLGMDPNFTQQIGEVSVSQGGSPQVKGTYC